MVESVCDKKCMRRYGQIPGIIQYTSKSLSQEDTQLHVCVTISKTDKERLFTSYLKNNYVETMGQPRYYHFAMIKAKLSPCQKVRTSEKSYKIKSYI